jgi:hypothetical protein
MTPNKWYPKIDTWPNGLPLPVWSDEADPRWLVAGFVRTEVGFSLYAAQQSLKALERAILDPEFIWVWGGNCVDVSIKASYCRLSPCDDGDGVPEHIKPVLIPSHELLEVLQNWLNIAKPYLS